MKRDLLTELTAWKTHVLRKPLVLRGARQVGKSWLIKDFSQNFESFIEINFERDQKLHAIFDGDLHIAKILEKLQLLLGSKLIPGKTLLFLDEIQECPNALKALRYFKEEMPELHVIAAGSLLDFSLEHIGMPVGRVQFMYLYPLSFGEFLTASGRDELRQYIKSKDIDTVIHQMLLEELRTYMWLGGMPAVVDAWLKYRDVKMCTELQDEVIAAYRQDFYKYTTSHKITHIVKVFDAIPAQFGKKFKFINVDLDLRSGVLKEALFLLEKAGIAHICYHSSGQMLPLGAEKNLKRFKVYFFDIGLAQRLSGLSIENWFNETLQVKTAGAMAEQLVAQELIAYNYQKKAAELFYWHREAKSSNAEIDFLTEKDTHIIPLEVKSGTTGKMKSMHLFLETHKNSPYGVKVSEGKFSQHHDIREIPLYALETWVKSS